MSLYRYIGMHILPQWVWGGDGDEGEKGRREYLLNTYYVPGTTLE